MEVDASVADLCELLAGVISTTSPVLLNLQEDTSLDFSVSISFWAFFVEFPFAPVAFLAFLRATSVLWEFRASRGISFQRSLEFPFAFKQKSSCFCVSLLRWLARGFCWINALQTCNLSPSHGLSSNERKNSNWICTIKKFKSQIYIIVIHMSLTHLSLR